MPLHLMESVYRMVEQVEAKSCRAIRFVEKESLSAMVAMRMAEKGACAHELQYQKIHDEQINYAVASQCGHLLRIFNAEESKRYLPIANKRTMMSYLMEEDDEIHRLANAYGKAKIQQMVVLWYEGIVYQLTRMPPEIMINKWIYDEYPMLRPLQLQALLQQRQAALMSLSDDLRRITPSKIFRAANIMNYTFFKAMEDHLHLDFVAPYHSTVFIFEGSALARVTKDEYVDDHEGDRAMIDKWADRLGLATWFEWKHMGDETNVS